MLNIAIIDDEKSQTDFLSVLVSSWSRLNDKAVSVHCYPSAESFQFEWCADKQFDVLLLDIQMDGMNGIELAKEIRKQDEAVSIIFITGLSEYIQEGYDVSALHYLIKPISQEKLFACLDKACSKAGKERPSVLVTSGSQDIRIFQDELLYAEAFAHTVFVQTIKTGFEIKMSIGELESRLQAPMFIRCHRSYVAGLKYVSKVGKTELVLDSGKVIPISRRLYQNVNQAFINYYRNGVV